VFGGYSEVSLMGYAVPLLIVLIVLSRSFTYGMIKPAADALYTRVPRETRYKGKNFVETAVWRFGDLIVTSGVSGLDKLGAAIGTMALIGAGAASAAVWVARKAAYAPDLMPEGGTDTTTNHVAEQV
jgi:ATP:ADP antiporter, AAA family